MNFLRQLMFVIKLLFRVNSFSFSAFIKPINYIFVILFLSSIK